MELGKTFDQWLAVRIERRDAMNDPVFELALGRETGVVVEAHRRSGSNIEPLQVFPGLEQIAVDRLKRGVRPSDIYRALEGLDPADFELLTDEPHHEEQ